MGINSSVLRAKTIKSAEIKHENPIKIPKTNHQGRIQAKPIKSPKTKHENPSKTQKINPHLSYYCGMKGPDPLDFANAYLVEIDATSLKIHDYVSYKSLLRFRNNCRNYRAISCFSPNPETYERSVLRGEVVPEDMDANNHATAAINQYNNITQNGKLKLERLIDSACYSLRFDDFFYILFEAVDMESSTRSIYQVGMAELGGQPLLGLLRDFSNDKVLAVISLKGTDDYLAGKKKNFVSSLRTGSSLGR